MSGSGSGSGSTPKATYRWRVTENGDTSTLKMEWVRGPDPLGLTSGRKIEYRAIKPWNCKCSSKLGAYQGYKFPKMDGPVCRTCLSQVRYQSGYVYCPPYALGVLPNVIGILGISDAANEAYRAATCWSITLDDIFFKGVRIFTGGTFKLVHAPPYGGATSQWICYTDDGSILVALNTCECKLIVFVNVAANAISSTPGCSFTTSPFTIAYAFFNGGRHDYMLNCVAYPHDNLTVYANPDTYTMEFAYANFMHGETCGTFTGTILYPCGVQWDDCPASATITKTPC